MQKERWNGVAGQAWVQSQAVLERVLDPFEALLVEEIGDGAVLDVGCGTGATTVAAARHAEHVVGVDISAPMIEAARERGGAEFIHADAQRHAFEPDSFDQVISRFGVMFFDDSVEAFANLRTATKPRGTLRLIVWRSADENPFMTTAEQAAKPLLPDLPVRDPDAPGQFAFADADKVRRILNDAGWIDVDLAPVDRECTLPEPQLQSYFTRLGPVGLVLQDQDEATRAQVIETVGAAFEPFVHDDEVRFTASCWLITGRNP